jgi:molybdopterin-guanine dinucleotide biosynthesis protein A
MSLPVGVILAGGKSRRFNGARKALMALDGKPLIEHVITRVRPQVSELLLSVESFGAELDIDGLIQVEDPVPGHNGPLPGLLSAMNFMINSGAGEWLLLVPCDAPFLPDELGRVLLESATNQGKPGSVVRYRGRLQPVFSLWNGSLLPSIYQAVSEQGIRGFKQYPGLSELALVDWPEPGLQTDSIENSGHDEKSNPNPFFNVNRREDLEQAARILESDPIQ